MVNYNLDGICFSLKAEHDFSWLKAMGRVFAVFSQNDSGNISFGVDSGREKLFVKVAGLETLETTRTKTQAMDALKSAAAIYEDIEHPSLIRLLRHCPVNDIYIAVFKWTEGDCLFDYWNFDKYNGDSGIIPPARRFKQLPTELKIKSAEILFSFLESVSKSGYVAVDFYDGSIIYDFISHTTTICDIDFFTKKPAQNHMGENYWGTKRVKAPEEYLLNAPIDEATNVYTLGALLLNNYFGNYTEKDIQLRYSRNRFMPCSFEQWDLSRGCYDTVVKATRLDRAQRYQSIGDFHRDWNLALNKN